MRTTGRRVPKSGCPDQSPFVLTGSDHEWPANRLLVGRKGRFLQRALDFEAGGLGRGSASAESAREASRPSVSAASGGAAGRATGWGLRGAGRQGDGVDHDVVRGAAVRRVVRVGGAVRLAGCQPGCGWGLSVASVDLRHHPVPGAAGAVGCVSPEATVRPCRPQDPAELWVYPAAAERLARAGSQVTGAPGGPLRSDDANAHRCPRAAHRPTEMPDAAGQGAASPLPSGSDSTRTGPGHPRDGVLRGRHSAPLRTSSRTAGSGALRRPARLHRPALRRPAGSSRRDEGYVTSGSRRGPVRSRSRCPGRSWAHRSTSTSST